MENWIEFVLERYNYWIVITLMMTGLYIVYARGNLVKKVVGLNLFQTSVFIFYITMGKIAGGTAPIYIGGELDHAGESHGNGQAGEKSLEREGHGEENLHDAPEGAPASSGDLHGGTDAPQGGDALHAKVENLPANDLKDALKGVDPGQGAEAGEGLHALPHAEAAKISNEALKSAGKTFPEKGFEVEGALHQAGDAANAMDGAHSALGEVIYSNPLPHVLILTAIVVGVATTAVGLALAVRIREAYGTIEEDELESMDNVAEFGDAAEARAI